MAFIVLAGLAQMDLVTGPGRAPLVAEGGLGIVGGVDPLARRWQVRRLPPAYPALVQVELGQPDPPQDLHGRDLAQPRRRGRAVDRVQEWEAVGADGLAKGVASLLALGQAGLLDAGGI